MVLLALAAPAHAGWSWPLRGEVITTYRNGDDPYAAGQHRGIDIAGAVGAGVVAAAAGEVRFAGVAGSSGLTVSVRTSDGRFDTSYLHLSAAAVKAGEQVAAGQRLGAVGVSGRRSAEASHLHFGVRDAGSQRYHDPLGLLPPLATAPETRPQAPPAGGSAVRGAGSTRSGLGAAPGRGSRSPYSKPGARGGFRRRCRVLSRRRALVRRRTDGECPRPSRAQCRQRRQGAYRR